MLMTIASVGQSTKEKNFALTLKMVVTALVDRDSLTLSKYIDPKNGVYILNRMGILDTYSQSSTLGFSDTRYPNAPIYDDIKLTTIKYSPLPTYDCVNWTKTGTFVDTTKTDHLLSKIAKNLNKEIKGTASPRQLKAFYDLENISRRVVIADKEGNDLIIYLSYSRNKWMLTIIDKVTSDCST
jgi:hypothetical protein